MINNSRGWGGAEQVLILLSSGLQAQGHSVVIFLREGAATVEPFRQAGFTVYPIKRHGARKVFSLFQLMREIRRIGVDLIHVHRNHDLLAGKTAALAAGVPLLLTQHCLLGSTSSWLINLADKIAVVSNFIGKDLTARFPGVAEKVQVIHNGIDLTPFTNPQPGYWDKVPAVAGNRPLLGVIGYFYKNQEELIELLPRIREKLPLVKLIIIGRDDAKQKILEQLAQECGVADAVYFPGKIPHSEIGDAMAGLDFNVSAFRREGCALNVIESLAVGTPFVGYRAGSYPELVIDSETGVLADTPDDFIQTLIQLAEQPERVGRMRQKAREDAFLRFGLKRMIEQYDDTIKKICGVESGRKTV